MGRQPQPQDETANVAPYSLPNIEIVSPRDNWRNVADRTTKKRIQNRVAQRVYRQRMKARVADLEAELRVAKLIAPKNAVEQHGPDSRAPVSLGKTSSNCQPASPNMTAPNIEGTVDRSSSDGSGSYLPKGQCIQGENYADESSAANDLTPDEYRDISNVLSASDIDSWPLEALRTEIQGHPAGPLGSDLHLHTGNLFDTQEMQTGIRHTSIEASSSSSTSPNLERLPLDERLDHIMKIANDMSFDSFDAVAEAYYISNFTPSSHLVNEQRLSRSRRLPNLLAKLCDAADHWSSWESRGFHDEIIKKAESLLVAENLAARQALAVAMSPIANRNHQEVQLSIDNFVAELKAKAPKELPNLFALMMSLAAPYGSTWQRDCSPAVFSALLILHYAGKLDMDNLLASIRSCL